MFLDLLFGVLGDAELPGTTSEEEHRRRKRHGGKLIYTVPYIIIVTQPLLNC